MGLAVSAGSASPRPESDHCTRTLANARRAIHTRETQCLKLVSLRPGSRKPTLNRLLHSPFPLFSGSPLVASYSFLLRVSVRPVYTRTESHVSLPSSPLHRVEANSACGRKTRTSTNSNVDSLRFVWLCLLTFRKLDGIRVEVETIRMNSMRHVAQWFRNGGLAVCDLVTFAFPIQHCGVIILVLLHTMQYVVAI